MAHHRLHCKILKHNRLISNQGKLPACIATMKVFLQGNMHTCAQQHFKLQSFISLFCFVSCMENWSKDNRHKDSMSDLHLVADIWSREDNRLDHMTPARRDGWGVGVREGDELWQLSVQGSDTQANRDKELLLPPEAMNYSGIQTL